MFDTVAKRYRGHAGGYTRMIPTRRRPGDAAELVALELVAGGEESVEAEKDLAVSSDAESTNS